MRDGQDLMREIVALVAKDLTLLLRDRGGFFFTFIFPLVFAVFFGTIFSRSGGESRKLPIAVVDEDSSADSRAVIAQLDTVAEFDTQGMSRGAAVEAVRLGRRVAYVAFPKGFGEARRRMFYGRGPEIELGFDPSRKAEAGMIQGLLARHLSAQVGQLLSNRSSLRSWIHETEVSVDSSATGGGRRGALRRFLGELDRFTGEVADSTPGAAGDGGGWQPVSFKNVDVARVRTGPRNAYQVSFPQGIVWGIFSCAFGFGLSLVHERTRGTLVRLRIAPISRGKILAAKATACMVAIVGIATLLLSFGALVFGVRATSPALLAIAVLSAAIAFVGLMMLFSVLGKTEATVSGLGRAAMLLMSMAGGGMVPLFLMPHWMQTVGSFTPVRWTILALEGAIWRDFTLSQMALPCGILLAIGVGTFAAGLKVFRWTEG